ncbi:hypothetical protein DFH27DRAFT_520514 [Peziza echinospora]|nr:hypothetical protein DFH27DRAFT_520514 [Peziza echinospora]
MTPNTPAGPREATGLQTSLPGWLGKSSSCNEGKCHAPEGACEYLGGPDSGGGQSSRKPWGNETNPGIGQRMKSTVQPWRLLKLLKLPMAVFIASVHDITISQACHAITQLEKLKSRGTKGVGHEHAFCEFLSRDTLPNDTPWLGLERFESIPEWMMDGEVGKLKLKDRVKGVKNLPRAKKSRLDLDEVAEGKADLSLVKEMVDEKADMQIVKEMAEEKADMQAVKEFIGEKADMPIVQALKEAVALKSKEAEGYKSQIAHASTNRLT